MNDTEYYDELDDRPIAVIKQESQPETGPWSLPSALIDLSSLSGKTVVNQRDRALVRDAVGLLGKYAIPTTIPEDYNDRTQEPAPMHHALKTVPEIAADIRSILKATNVNEGTKQARTIERSFIQGMMSADSAYSDNAYLAITLMSGRSILDKRQAQTC